MRRKSITTRAASRVLIDWCGRGLRPKAMKCNPSCNGGRSER
ncbi:MAG: hypothetical protein ACTS5A_02670 [Candidatus Hodgkinia cicadicola]